MQSGGAVNVVMAQIDASDEAALGCAVQEGSLMAEPVDTAIRVLAHRGPTWRAPLVIDVLRSLPIMRQVRPAPGLQLVLTARMSTLSLRVVPALDARRDSG